MPYLDNLSDTQKALVVALPYRVGLWVSRSDDEGGDESEALEMRTLEALLVGYSQDCCKSELVEEILSATLAGKDSWTTWQNNLDQVNAECQEMMLLFGGRVPPELLFSFKSALMDIALAVAGAYTEHDDGDGLSAVIGLYWRYVLERLSALKDKRMPLTLEQMESISRSEQNVLAQLAATLDIDITQAA